MTLNEFKRSTARFLRYGLRPGDFAYAVLTNDLRGAVAHADGTSKENLFDIVVWTHFNVPAKITTPEGFNAHLRAGAEKRKVLWEWVLQDSDLTEEDSE